MIFNWQKFLTSGYFIGSPLFNKVWCLYENDDQLISFATPDFAPHLDFFYRNNFDRSAKLPWLSGETFFTFKLNKFFEMLSELEDVSPIINWLPENQEIYEAAFQKIKSGIMNRTISKAVPFYRAIGHSELSQKNLVFLFKRLIPLLKNKNLFFYGAWNFKKQTLQFGASPELLFIKNKNTLTTNALAGTSINPKIDFHRKKIKNEHDYVVQDLFYELQKYGDVKKHRSNILKFKNYFHKNTKFSVNCENKELKFEDLLTSVYPSAAIGAYPRHPGIEFLQRVERETDLKRSFFAAPFGIQTKEKFMLCLSAIRGIEWDKGELSVTAGGGIVEQSSLEEEWQEICLKVQSIKSIFGIT